MTGDLAPRAKQSVEKQAIPILGAMPTLAVGMRISGKIHNMPTASVGMALSQNNLRHH
jgi:hypothetical protein